MPDYAQSKIYKIVCNDTGKTYYGSTTQMLCKRLAGHKRDFKNNYGGCSSREIFEGDNYQIILCEECPCENKEQLLAIERKWIEENECVNKKIPNRTKQEYKENNKIKIIDYHRNYYQRNKEKIREQQRIYRENNKV